MEDRIALVGIIVENPDAVEQLNAILHEYSSSIIGRMGIPYREKTSPSSALPCAPPTMSSAL